MCLGRQILALESTRSILVSSFPPSQVEDKYSREPFRSPALEMVDKLNSKQPRDIIYKEKMARLAMDIGLNQVVRWKPGKVGSPGVLEGAFLTSCSTAREPRGLRPDRRLDDMSVCHRRCDWPAARCRGGPQGGQGKDSEQTRRHEGVVAIASNSNCINLYHITPAGTCTCPTNRRVQTLGD